MLERQLYIHTQSAIDEIILNFSLQRGLQAELDGQLFAVRSTESAPQACLLVYNDMAVDDGYRVHRAFADAELTRVA